MSDLLIVFLKVPRPGFVKTRLAASVGAVHAAHLYRVMTERVLARTERECRVVFYAPADAGAEVQAWLPDERALVQSEGDLGARMAAAFQWAFGDGAARAVLIGTDVPDLSHDVVRGAFESLRTHDVVLGPSLDGGYYLIGLRRPAPALFDGVAWSTPAVLGQTLERAESLGLCAASLPVRGDVDTLGDLRREWPRLRRWLPRELAEAMAKVITE